MTPSAINYSQIKRMLGLALIAVSVPAPFADAFRSSATVTPPVVASLDAPKDGTKQLLPQRQLDETTESSADTIKILLENVTTTPRRKHKYDLGLGKHKPVTNTRAEEESDADTSLDPTRFLVEHETVRSYPSPLDSNSLSRRRNDHGTKRDRKNLPTVKHRRHSQDVLRIQDPRAMRKKEENRYDDSSYPVIVPIPNFSAGSSSPVAKLDVNTVWVEMMLHNEQQKMFAQRLK